MSRPWSSDYQNTERSVIWKVCGEPTTQLGSEPQELLDAKVGMKHGLEEMLPRYFSLNRLKPFNLI